MESSCIAKEIFVGVFVRVCVCLLSSDEFYTRAIEFNLCYSLLGTDLHSENEIN